MKNTIVTASILVLGTLIQPQAFAKGFHLKAELGDLNTQFNQLPLEGSVRNSQIPWADSYWPKNRGGAAFRWRTVNETAKQNLTPEEAQSLFFNVELPTKNDLINMSREEIANLSPAEKFDIVKGDFDFPLTRSYLGRKNVSRKMKNSPYDAYWEGYCNAWAAVSLHYGEPKPVTRQVKIKGNYIDVPFGSGDIKALMVASYAQSLDRNPQVGNFCHETFSFPETKMYKGKEIFAQYSDTDGLLEADYASYARKFQDNVKRLGYNPVPDVNPNSSNFLVEMLTAMNKPDCSDTNAGEFHLLMVNQLGLMKEGFVIDKTRDNEIWNQPVFKYTSKIVGPVAMQKGRSRNAASAIQVKTTVFYADDTDYGWTFWNPTLTSLFNPDASFLDEFAKYGRMLMNQGDETEALKYPDGVIGKSHYIYNLELDSTGNIVGGEWVTFDRPDVAWMPKRFAFKGDFSELNGLYEPIQISDQAVLHLSDE